MAPSSISFSSPTPLLSRRAHYVVGKNVPVCVLEERSTVKLEPPTQGKNVRSPFYRILPPDLPREERPEPPPLHRTVPIFGFLIEHWLNLGSVITRARKYGAIYRSSFILMPMHVITDMEASVDIQKDSDTFRSSGSSDVMKLIFGADTMTLLDGPDHTTVRNMVAPAFAPTLFPFYFDSIRNRVEKTWKRVENDAKMGGKRKLDPIFREHYLSIVIEMTTGIDMDSDQASSIRQRFLKMVFAFFTPPVGPIWNAGIQARDEVKHILGDLVRRNLVEKKETIDKLREYGDNLSYLGSKDIAKGDVNVLLIAIARSTLKTGENEENDPEVIQSLTNLMLLLWFAGYATSATTSSCACFEMGMDLNIWDVLAAEQDKLVDEAGSKVVTYDQVKTKMPLLDSYINEMLRMHPAAVGVLRVPSSDVEVLGKYVKAGERVLCDFKAAMRDARMYPDPDVIKVDRFMKKPGKAPVPRVIGFGAPGSPHYCLGAALAMVLMKTTFSVLLRKYRLEMDPNQSRKYAVVPDDTPKSKVVVQSFEKRP